MDRDATYLEGAWIVAIPSNNWNTSKIDKLLEELSESWLFCFEVSATHIQNRIDVEFRKRFTKHLRQLWGTVTPWVYQMAG